MGKVDVNKKQKENALLTAAFEVFTSQGVNKTSISDIAKKAGVAKGTFYLYFADKYDIRNRLIAHKAEGVFGRAEQALRASGIEGFEDRMIFFINDILDQFVEDKSLLTFISKNLSWGLFKTAITPIMEMEMKAEDEDDGENAVQGLLDRVAPGEKFEEPEVLIYMIVELVSASCYSSILYGEPVEIEKLKPYIFDAIRGMIARHRVSPQ